ncbi:hypothetical protein [Paenibacillus sp. USHLN196]|uniref:hypothetical protein n=1 Tax=Paenibacillus sp. USHLN196 TaxID=3081291 RepID=UPI0030191113
MSAMELRGSRPDRRESSRVPVARVSSWALLVRAWLLFLPESNKRIAMAVLGV